MGRVRSLKTLVIYDADADGFGSAWAAWKALGDSADYVEIGHGTKELPLYVFEYDRVYILDLSFPRDELLDLRECTNLTVIDHHESAAAMLEELGVSRFVPVDTTRAACVQVWEHFFPEKATPLMLQYIADRDVWAWELPHSDEINAVIFTGDKDFEKWDKFNTHLETAFDEVLLIGSALLEYREKMVDQIVANHYHDLAGIPVVHANVLHSEVGHRLLDTYPDAPYVMTYMDNVESNTRKFSLRSEDHRMDVGEIAKEFGGGGHRNAAGYTSAIWGEELEAV